LALHYVGGGVDYHPSGLIVKSTLRAFKNVSKEVLVMLRRTFKSRLVLILALGLTLVASAANSVVVRRHELVWRGVCA